MTIKIPLVSKNDMEAKIYSKEEAVDFQWKEMALFRKIMSCLVKENNSNYLSLEENEDDFVQMYYHSVDTRFLTNCIMHSWYNGELLRKSDLRRMATHISEATFNRFLKYIIAQNLVKRSEYANDKRYAVLKPTKRFISICQDLHLRRLSTMIDVFNEHLLTLSETEKGDEINLEFANFSRSLSKIVHYMDENIKLIEI